MCTTSAGSPLTAGQLRAPECAGGPQGYVSHTHGVFLVIYITYGDLLGASQPISSAHPLPLASPDDDS
jgi:hypothetical protein